MSYIKFFFYPEDVPHGANERTIEMIHKETENYGFKVDRIYKSLTEKRFPFLKDLLKLTNVFPDVLFIVLYIDYRPEIFSLMNGQVVELYELGIPTIPVFMAPPLHSRFVRRMDDLVDAYNNFIQSVIRMNAIAYRDALYDYNEEQDESELDPLD